MRLICGTKNGVLTTVTTILLVGTVLCGGCDRQDNHWGAYDPGQKIVTFAVDTLRLNEGGEARPLTVTLMMVPDDTVRVILSADAGQAVAHPETLVFLPQDDDWARRLTTEIEAVDDLVDEGDHADALSVIVASRDADYAAQGGPGLVPVLLSDDDAAGVQISETALTLVESAGGVFGETYRVRMLSQPTADVTISVTVSPTDATFHVDPFTFVFTPNDWDDERVVSLWSDLDQDHADDSSFVLSHAAASADANYDTGLAIASVAVDVFDDTLPPIARLQLAIPDQNTLNEATPGATTDVTVSLDHPSVAPVTLHLATENGTATAGADFVALDQDIVFQPDDPLTRTFALSVFDDTFVELTESFSLVLTQVQGAIIGADDRLTLQIVDDDWVMLTLTASDVAESAGAAEFVVSMPVAQPTPVGFTFVTAAGTATAGDDYESVNEVFTIEPGQIERVVPVVIFSDPDHEPDELFTGRLEQLTSNAVWNGIPLTCTILDDDPQLVTMSDVVVDETAGNVFFTVEMASPFDVPVTLTVSTFEGDGSLPANPQEQAEGNLDFMAYSGVPWTIDAHVTQALFRVPLYNDTQAEARHEFFRLLLVTASQPGFAGVTATATIVDDDQPLIVMDNVSVNETVLSAPFQARLQNAVGGPVVSTADVTFLAVTVDQTATAGGDYIALSETVTIPAGVSGVPVTVDLQDDVHDDDSETFVLHLSEPLNAIIDPEMADPFCAITDDEFPSINLVAALDRANEGSTFVFTVGLTTPRQEPTTYTLSLQPGNSQGEAIDYIFGLSGPQSVPPFTSSVTFTVPFLDDQIAGESDETLTAVISDANVALGVTWIDLTIVDAPELTIGPATALEGDDAVFPVTLSAVSTSDIQFQVQYSSESADVGADIDSSNRGPFLIPAGQAGTVVPVPTVASDGGDLAVEQFTVAMISPVNATLSGFNAALGSIVDGDPSPLSFSGPAQAVEGTDLEFTVELAWTSEADIDFNVQFTDGTAAGAGIDYDDSATGPYTIPAGASSIVVAVPTVADGGPELTVEDFTITLVNATNAVIGATPSVVGQVLDGDQPQLSLPAGDTVIEGGALAFTVHLDRQSVVPVFFNLVYLNGSTQGAADYAANPGPFSMMPGTTDTTITVLTVEDLVHENQEIFVVGIGADPTNAVPGAPAQANGVIDDDDP